MRRVDSYRQHNLEYSTRNAVVVDDTVTYFIVVIVLQNNRPWTGGIVDGAPVWTSALAPSHRQCVTTLHVLRSVALYLRYFRLRLLWVYLKCSSLRGAIHGNLTTRSADFRMRQ